MCSHYIAPNVDMLGCWAYFFLAIWIFSKWKKNLGTTFSIQSKKELMSNLSSLYLLSLLFLSMSTPQIFRIGTPGVISLQKVFLSNLSCLCSLNSFVQCFACETRTLITPSVILPSSKFLYKSNDFLDGASVSCSNYKHYQPNPQHEVPHLCPRRCGCLCLRDRPGKYQWEA